MYIQILVVLLKINGYIPLLTLDKLYNQMVYLPEIYSVLCILRVYSTNHVELSQAVVYQKKSLLRAKESVLA